MKKYLISGLVIVLFFTVTIIFLVNEAPDRTRDITPAMPSGLNKNNGSVKELVQKATGDGKGLSSELSSDSLEIMALAKQKLYKLITSIFGFENTVLLTQKESDEYQQWQRESGLMVRELQNSDYASYDKEALYALAEQGDLSAYETLRSKPGISKEVEKLNRLGLVLGASSASYGLTSDASSKAEAAYNNGDYEAYRHYFVEGLALLEFSKMRGMIVPQSGVKRVLAEYKLDDDIGIIQFQSQQRNLEILEEVNAGRRLRGWGPLDNELPAAVKKQQAASACQGDKECLKNI